MCNVEIAEVYVVENAPYCKLNYNMARFLFYLLSFLYYLRGYFYCFLFSHTHSSLFFLLFCLAVGIFPGFCSHIPIAVYFLLHFCLAVGIFPGFCSHIPIAVYFLLHFCLAVGIFPDLCFPYPHFMFYLFFDGSCASIIAANISTHPALSLIDRLSCKITHPASTEKQDSRLSINDAIVGLTFLCPII